MDAKTRSVRVLVFGRSGDGKTSLINELTNSNYPTSPGATGCTFKSMICPSFRDGVRYEFIDTAGLNEGKFGTVKCEVAIQDLVNLLKKSIEGYNLIIYVKSAQRLLDMDERNYDLFVNCMTNHKIPVIAVITHCEAFDNLQDWVFENRHEFEERGMKFNCMVGTCFGKGGVLEKFMEPLRRESGQNVWKAITTYAAPQPVKFLSGAGSFLASLRKTWNSFCDICVIYGKLKPAEQWKIISHKIHDLLIKLGLQEKEARKLSIEIQDYSI